ncbi:phosphotransferase family protein [Goodfellowiella coeruleoviolacea]|uniref:Fructosamine-3-kinase n=1 Tax=Goodfellowiella coeruleoviolacea TaxID=334858 RepID=A0AAE3GA27_9PSEU|nr:aminoglycoside phosphotransferase family protein [Goodfellowiella coeruleoviolacea]MCP2163169.1 Fructosamine-3-kinase [Goodfellowiella coeruleoviolacea]
MPSRTARRVSAEELAGAVAEAFGPATRITAAEELTDGTYNAVWRLDLDPVGPVVLKVAPRAEAPRLTYERRILRTEAAFLRLASGVAPLPVPHHLGRDSAALGGDFLVTSMLPGQPWHRLRGRLDRSRRQVLRRELGRIVARLHGIRGSRFGYPEPGTGLSGDTWGQACTAMLAAVLADAERFGVALPAPAADITALVRAQRPVLDEVTEPVLVHFDLWEGNVMLDTGAPAGPRIAGLIDAERAFWGDPLADFVSLALFGDIEDDPALLAGYREAGGRAVFTPAARRRLLLYQAYLYLIMTVEGVPRGTRGPAALLSRRLAARGLTRALRALHRATEVMSR